MIKVVICDDEKGFVDKLEALLEQYIHEHDIRMEVKKYYDADSFLKQVDGNNHIIFLDINLGKMDGIEIAKELRKRKINSIIIYISAYIEMAPMGYEVKAFRYILKNDLERVWEYTMADAMKEIVRRNRNYEIKTQGKSESIKIDEIIYFASFKRYVEIYTKNSTYKQYRRMVDLGLELEEKGFIRIHKSYLVNMRYIKCLKNREVYLKNGSVLPCSKPEYQKLKQKYILWKGIV